MRRDIAMPGHATPGRLLPVVAPGGAGADLARAPPVQKLIGEKKDQAVWLKKADPAKREGERYQVYEQRLA